MPCSIPAERLLMLSEPLSSISAAIWKLYNFYSGLLYTICGCYNYQKPGKLTINTTIILSAASSTDLYWASFGPGLIMQHFSLPQGCGTALPVSGASLPEQQERTCVSGHA